MKDNIWSEIRSNFEDEGVIHIDAWISGDDNEEGKVIATIDKATSVVSYRDDRAKTDAYAQEIIAEVLADLTKSTIPDEDANFTQFMVEMNGKLKPPTPKNATDKIEDLTYDIDVRGDYALFIEKKHFIEEWKLDNEAREAAGGITFFRVIRDGVQQSGHGWIENGEIVQWG
ncbi:MAG: hypothetical protein WC333_02150 [Dehalococcoidia bacterium]|jgi:hypothetical protein